MRKDEAFMAKATRFRVLASRATDLTVKTRAEQDAEHYRILAVEEYYRMLAKHRARATAEGVNRSCADTGLP